MGCLKVDSHNVSRRILIIPRPKNTYSCFIYKNPQEHIVDFENEKIGLINIGNTCYMNSFLQIFFHCPDLLSCLRMEYAKMNNKDRILSNLLNLSEYPYNKKLLYNLKESLGDINEEYSNYCSNDSQLFGIELISYLIEKTKNSQSHPENNKKNNGESNTLASKKEIYDNYIKTYQPKLNSLQELFVLNQSESIFSSENLKNIQIFSYVDIGLAFTREAANEIFLEDLLKYKYLYRPGCSTNSSFFILKKIITLPKILIISINRATIGHDINKTDLIFKENLDLSDYIDYELFENRDSSTTYHLFAVNQNCVFRKYAHYSCYIKLSNIWYYFDDSKQVVEKNPDFRSPYVVGLYYIKDKKTI